MQHFSPNGAGPEPGDSRPAWIPVRHPFCPAERVRHPVSPQVLHQRQLCGVHHVYYRCRSESGGRQQHPPGDEKCQRSGQLSQPVYVLAERQKDEIQIIPLSEVAAKDEFLNIKNVSRDDMMAAHRVPPQMMGIMPSNVWGFGGLGMWRKRRMFL